MFYSSRTRRLFVHSDVSILIAEVSVPSCCFFFFQAEDGIRDADVTGVQTCALPISSSFTMALRKQLVKELAPLRKNALEKHPWRAWAQAEAKRGRMPGAQSRWSAGKDLSWEPLRAERVCEVKYDHLQGDRFRHAATFLRWRPDKRPRDCRYDQLEVTRPYQLAKVFSSGSSRS